MSGFDDVFVDEDEMNEELIGSILKDRINIGNEGGKLYFREGFSELSSAAQKLAVVLTARKAAAQEGVIDKEEIGPSGLTEKTGLKKGTVDSALKTLRDKNLAKSDDGSYHVPNPNLRDVKEFVVEEE